jgi:RNA polymerase sigma-70 factor (ECF subfamily)
MQEISLAAIRQQSPLRDPAKAGPWLYRLAVRQVLLYRRKQGRQRKLWDRYQATCSAAEAGDRSGDPLVWILSDERRSLIRTSLERLPERDAAVLLLKYTEHWSYQQIAEHLGIGQAAVESRLHRARARLRAELTARDVFEVRR